MLRFSKSRIEAARTELEECGGYIFSGDFDQVISDLYKAIEGGEFDD